MFFLSDSAIGEAVGNAKRERSERGAFSVAVAVALSGSFAVDVGRVAGGVCGRQRWPSGWVCRKRGRLSGRLAGVGVSDGRLWLVKLPSASSGRRVGSLAVSVGRRAGSGVNVCDCRAVCRVGLAGVPEGVERVYTNGWFCGGRQRWPSAVAVRVGVCLWPFPLCVVLGNVGNVGGLGVWLWSGGHFLGVP